MLIFKISADARYKDSISEDKMATILNGLCKGAGYTCEKMPEQTTSGSPIKQGSFLGSNSWGVARILSEPSGWVGTLGELTEFLEEEKLKYEYSPCDPNSNKPLRWIRLEHFKQILRWKAGRELLSAEFIRHLESKNIDINTL